jgi:hypothetical protein
MGLAVIAAVICCFLYKMQEGGTWLQLICAFSVKGDIHIDEKHVFVGEITLKFSGQVIHWILRL